MSSLVELVSASKSSVAITDLVKMANTLSLGRFSGEPREFPVFRMDVEMMLDGLGLKSLLYDAEVCKAVVPVSRVLSSALYKALPTMRQRISVLPKYIPGTSKSASVATSSASASSVATVTAASSIDNSATITQLSSGSAVTLASGGAITSSRLNELAQHVSGLVLPCTIWSMVVSDCDRNTGIHRSALRMKLHGLRMVDSFQSFKTDLEVLCNQLATMGCNIDEGEKFAVLFRGMANHSSMAAALPECELLVGRGQTYADVCAYLDMHFALRAVVRPSVANAVSGQRNIVALAVDSGGIARCTGCNKKGHVAEKCWRLHPELKPHHNGARPLKSARSRTMRCFACNEVGHKKAVCPNSRPKSGYPSTKSSEQKVDEKSRDVNRLMVSMPGPFTTGASSSNMSNNGLSIAALHVAQMRARGGQRDCLFYIDTAADVHVCNDRSMFVDLRPLCQPQAMFAYDGSSQVIEMSGTIRLCTIVKGYSRHILLKDVVYNPHSEFNLISEYLLSKLYDSRMMRSKWIFTDRNSKQPVLTAVRYNYRWAVIMDAQATHCPVGGQVAPPRHDHAARVLSTAVTNQNQPIGVSSSTGRAMPLVWHARLGHMSVEHMHLLVKHGLVEGLNSDKQFTKCELDRIRNCDICLRCKSNKLPFRTGRRVYQASRCLERLWIDLSGRFPVEAVNGESYYLSVTDEFSHYVTIYLLSRKSEALPCLQNYLQFWKARRPKDPVMYIRSDNGGEFTSTEYKEWCASQGIMIEFTVPGCPQQNGVSERMNQTIMRPVRSMMQMSRLPPSFWSFAVMHAVTILNLSPTTTVQHMSASEVLIGRMSDVSSLRIFGCLAYFTDANAKPDKLSERSQRCVYLGVDSMSAGCLLWHIEKQCTVVGRHVRCVEDVFPDPHPASAPADNDYDCMNEWLNSECVSDVVSSSTRATDPQPSVEAQPVIESEAKGSSHGDPMHRQGASESLLEKAVEPPSIDEVQLIPPRTASPATPHYTSTSSPASTASSALPSVPTMPVHPTSTYVPSVSERIRPTMTAMPVPARLRVRHESLPVEAKTSTATTRRPVTRSQSRALVARDQDVVESAAEYRSLLQALQESEAEAKQETSHDARRVCATNCDMKSLNESLLSEALEWPPEPTTADSALSSTEAMEWKTAMQNELNSMDSHGVWTLVRPVAGKQIVSCRWVFKRKMGADGKIERYKARLVARGFEQRYGVNYEETWAPTALFKSYRLLLALSGHYHLTAYQLDVQSAYLNGTLAEEVYMAMPDGCNDGSGRVCRLHKAIYGLKQAARSWYEELSNALIRFGLHRCAHDPCLYVRVVSGHVQIVLVYVDDICDATSDKLLHDELVSYLDGLYGVVDKGVLSWFLNHSVVQTPTCIYVHQQSYISRVVAKFRNSNPRRVFTPMDPGWSKSEDQGVMLSVDEHTRYRQLVGCLMYLAVATRPDICFAVGECARHVAAPTSLHMSAAIRVLQYVASTNHFALTFQKQSGTSDIFKAYPLLAASSDATWASDPESMRSVTGFVLFVGGSPVDWSSHMQPVVAGSSHDAELIALAACIADVKWFRGVLGELLVAVIGRVPAWKVDCDNKGAIESVYRGPLRQQKRVIGVKIAVVRESVLDEEVAVAWCPTRSNVADLFTKPLMRSLFEGHRGVLVSPGVSSADK